MLNRTSPSIVFSIRLYEYQSSRPILRQAYYFTPLLDILRFFFSRFIKPKWFEEFPARFIASH